MSAVIRPAAASDMSAIRALMRGERMNPTSLDWQCFMVACDERRVIGAAQLRRHAGNVRELGSLIVQENSRSTGLAARIIDALLDGERGSVWMITAERFSAHYARWNFRRIVPGEAPWPIRRNYYIGRLGRIVSFVLGMPPNNLIILERPAAVLSAPPDTVLET